jgi:hypothetical protein
MRSVSLATFGNGANVAIAGCKSLPTQQIFIKDLVLLNAWVVAE